MAIDSLDRVNMFCLMHDTCLCQKDVTQKPSMELKHNTKPDVKQVHIIYVPSQKTRHQKPVLGYE